MSKKTLWVLVIVLAGLSAAVWWSGRREAAPAGPAASGSGRLLPAVDLNAIRAIVFENGASTARLAKVDGVWSVAELDGYPADFSRLRDLLRSIDETENAQLAEEGAAHLAEYGLAVGAEPAPLRIALEHDQGTTVLSLGKPRESRRTADYWGPPAGRYVRVDEGPVLLIKEDLRGADADPAQWWDRRLLDVPLESIRKVELGGGEHPLAVARDTNGVFALAGAAAGEEIDASAANRLFGALRNLRAEKILASEENDAAFANAGSYVAETEGATYRIQIGEAQADQGGGRPVKIEVAGEAETAAAKKLNGRTFLIPAYLAEPLLMKKQELVRTTPPAPEEASEAAPPAEPPPAPADGASAETAEP